MSPALVAALTESDARLKAEWKLNAHKPAGVFIDKPVVTPRAITNAMIVCGDCAGDDQLPRHTLMAADRSCSSCGGRSYIFA